MRFRGTTIGSPGMELLSRSRITGNGGMTFFEMP